MADALRVIKAIAVTDSVLTATSVAEADHPVWSASIIYGVGDRAILPATHKIYESSVAGNIGNHPVGAVQWIEIGPTNRWKAFDMSSTTQTVIGESDYFELHPGRAVNALALVNISGLLTVRVRMTDPVFGVVFDSTASLLDVPSASSWYAWFFDPRTEQDMFVITTLPSYPNAVLRVDMTSSGAAYIGVFLVGSMRTIGEGVLQGGRLGIQDFSRKERNDYGDTVLVQRAFAKRTSIDFLIRNSELDNAYDLLADLRATPCLWLCSKGYRSLAIYGFYNNFEIGITYTARSECSIDLEGLT